MKISKKVIILSFLCLGISFISSAQESKVTIEFKNAETAVKLIRTYTEALQTL
ncbi:hypothetical protein KO504_08715 [Winogradskyella psychrotolerans]|uniref:hypothetical protein n=1 Tax=Winogradskyella psychrotolerans TaxID=1344585 RepID=UPI001C06D482|nr:hypothetical protein [Winogradskyella psychrotolerans]MBU2921422.1 hypothetical protein [Winogradskyella psychrotolerans]